LADLVLDFFFFIISWKFPSFPNHHTVIIAISGNKHPQNCTILISILSHVYLELQADSQKCIKEIHILSRAKPATHNYNGMSNYCNWALYHIV